MLQHLKHILERVIDGLSRLLGAGGVAIALRESEEALELRVERGAGCEGAKRGENGVEWRGAAGRRSSSPTLRDSK